MDQSLWEKAIAFHGHACPGLAVGVRAAQIALEKFGANRAEDEELVCVTENDACGVDGIQAILGCTFGKGNLIYRGTGKQAYSFFERKSGRRLRTNLRRKTGWQPPPFCCRPLKRRMQHAMRARRQILRLRPFCCRRPIKTQHPQRPQHPARRLP